MTTTQPTYSFTSTQGNAQSSYQSQKGNTARVSAPSPGQIKFYMDLTTRKRVAPVQMDIQTFESMGKLIEELRLLPDPASPAQLDKIRSLHAEITALYPETKPLIEEKLNALTGGQNGTASATIQRMFEIKSSLSDKAEPSVEQLEKLVSWFFCPDIPFENFSIEKKKYLDKLTTWSTDVDVPADLEKRPYRLLTPSEFAEQIKLRMSKRQASAFIDEHRGTYYDWKRTRINANQINYIRTLEGRLSNIYVPKAVIEAVDFDGDVFTIPTSSSHDTRGELQTTGYQGLSEHDLIQMSYEDASTFIDQLKSELADPTIRNIGSPYDDSQNLLNDKLATFDDVRKTGNLAHDETSGRVKEFTILNDLIFKLESVAGYKNDELHENIKESVLDGDGDVSNPSRVMFMDFMEQTLDHSTDERLLGSIGRLYTMSEDSEVATAIVKKLANKVLAKMLM